MTLYVKEVITKFDSIVIDDYTYCVPSLTTLKFVLTSNNTKTETH